MTRNANNISLDNSPGLIMVTNKLCKLLLLIVIVSVKTSGAVESQWSNNSAATNPAANRFFLGICRQTEHPDLCIKNLEASVGIEDSLSLYLKKLSKLSSFPDKLIAKYSDDEQRLKSALTDCKKLFDDALDRLNDAIKVFYSHPLSSGDVNDIRTWLSTAITDQETCLDGVRELIDHTPAAALAAKALEKRMKSSGAVASKSLAKFNGRWGAFPEWDVVTFYGFDRSGIVKHVWTESDELDLIATNTFPDWLSPDDGRLLLKPKPRLTVAKDGSGDYKTIREAVAAALDKNESRFVIYVKEGKYVENVIVDKNKWNVMIYGDGMNKTIVSGSLNFVDGNSTFSTATFAAEGKRFIARDIGFENTAGAEKHQAVALRSGSDRSIFYRCSFDGFQGTLYVHSNRQYYRNCVITGTIDFIFGNAEASFQGCYIKPRQPLPNQINTITAQGKTDPNQNTVISIRNSNIFPHDNVTVDTYLGRPWKNFSTTIILKTHIDSFVNPLGWTSNIIPPDTIFYVEHQNTGPGSSINQRVDWAGYRSNLTEDEASRLQLKVGSFMFPGFNQFMLDKLIHPLYLLSN